MRPSYASSQVQARPNFPLAGQPFGICPSESGQEPWRGHDPEPNPSTQSPRSPEYGISTGPLPRGVYRGGY
jgi:hypothetical protein